MNYHLYDRINNRLSRLVNAKLIDCAERVATRLPLGKFYVELEKYNRSLHICCPENVNGDALVAIVRDNTLITIMLTKSWRREYFNDGKYITINEREKIERT